MVSIFLLFLIPPFDTDLGWHLRYGDHFLRYKSFLTDNTLTYFMPDYKWSHSYSLYQILVSYIYKYFHLWGLTFINGILGVLTYIFFSKVVKNTRKESYLLFLLIFYISKYIFFLGLRAQLFSVLFFLIGLFLTKSYLNSKNKLYLLFLVPLSILWVNTHGAFILIFLLIFSLIPSLIYKNEIKQAYYVFLVSLLLFISTLINPYGIHIYLETFKHFYYPLGSLIAEWVPSGWINIIIIILTLLSSFMLGLKYEKKYLGIFYLVLLIPLAYMSLKAKRNLVLYLFTYGAFLLNFQEKLKNKLKNYDYYLNILTYGSVFILFIYIISSYLPPKLNLLSSEDKFWKGHPINYPVMAALELKKLNVNDKNVFSSYEWGGYLSYFDANNKHFTDGRMPAWDTSDNISPYSSYLYIIQANDGWDKILNETNTEILLLPNNTFLEVKLGDGNNEWIRVWKDPVSSIYIKNEI